MFNLNLNKPIKVAHLQKLANQYGMAHVIQMVINFFSESKKNFGRLTKQGTLQ